MSESTQAEETGASAAPDEGPRLGVAARALIVAGIAIVVGVIVLIIVGGGNDDGSGIQVASPYDGAELVEPSDLASLQEEAGHPVFWAGQQKGLNLGFSQDGSGNVHLRYLPDGVEADTSAPVGLDVGSYPFPNAYAATKDLSTQPGRVPVEVDGGVGFYVEELPTSVILSFRSEPDLQVEVFHPEPKVALNAVKSGDIVSVS